MATRTVTVRTASAGTLAQVPDVVNHQQESALATLGTAGFESRVKAAPASEAAGVVVKESPAAGRKVRRGSAITLLVSLGKAKPRRLATRPRAERFEARQNRGAGDTHRRRPGFAYRVRRLGGCRRPSHLAEPRRRSQSQARHRGAPRGFAASLALHRRREASAWPAPGRTTLRPKPTARTRTGDPFICHVGEGGGSLSPPFLSRAAEAPYSYLARKQDQVSFRGM